MRHIDEEFAARSMFGGLTASGAHTFAHGQLTAGIAHEMQFLSVDAATGRGTR